MRISGRFSFSKRPKAPMSAVTTTKKVAMAPAQLEAGPGSMLPSSQLR
jgi:hypothetical protein